MFLQCSLVNHSIERLSAKRAHAHQRDSRKSSLFCACACSSGRHSYVFLQIYIRGTFYSARLSDDCIELLSDDSIEHLSYHSIECPPDPRQNSYVFLMIEFLCLSNR